MESDKLLFGGIEGERFLKTGSFAFKLMIKIEAKKTGGKIQAYGWTLKRSSNKRGDVFGWVCVICVAWEV